MSNKTSPPLLFAIGMFLIVPVAAMFCLFIGIAMILAWPFLPIISYFQRKEEISKEKKGQ